MSKKPAILYVFLCLFCSCGILQALSRYGMGGVILPAKSSYFKNPAFLAYNDDLKYRSGFQIPLGLIGLFSPKRNPFLYFKNINKFTSRFDFLSFYNQIIMPNILLFNTAESAGEVVFFVSKQKIDITDGDGNNIAFRDVTGPQGISIAGTPLIPPPILGLTFKCRNVYFITGIFIGSGGYSTKPNPNLNKALSGEEVKPDTEYAIESIFNLQAGLSQDFIYVKPVDINKTIDTVTFAVRLKCYYTMAYADIKINAGTVTDNNTIPSSANYENNFYYFYPSKGFGLGSRVDAGVAIEIGSINLGFSILNLYGISFMKGRQTDNRHSFKNPQTHSELFLKFKPEFFFNCSFSKIYRSTQLVFAFDAGFTKSLVFHCGILIFIKKIFFSTGLGWEGQVRFGFGTGIILKKNTLEIALASYEKPFTRGRTFGLAVNWGIRLK